MSTQLNNTGVTFPDSSTQPKAVPASGPATNVLVSDGTWWVSGPAPGFPTGTAMIFQQTAAPTGWTKSVALNDYGLRVTSGAVGTGGSLNFSSLFSAATSLSLSGGSVSATTLTSGQVPSVSVNVGTGVPGGGGGPGIYAVDVGVLGDTWSGNHQNLAAGSSGGGGSHTHALAGTTAVANMALRYVDVIIATKN